MLADPHHRAVSDREGARRHGVSRGRVWQIWHAAGIPPWTPPPRPLPERSPVFWSDEEIAYLIDYADEPAADVATALGRGVRAAYGMCERLAR